MFDNIPHEMRLYKQWVCWKLVERENAKPTKVPINPNNGQNADVTNPNDWSSYETAVAVSSRVSGIGFVLTDNDPYAFLDLDNCHGDVEAMARQVKVYNLFNSYSELSPSGNGLHIIVKGSVPIGRRRNAIEIYSEKRFMTMTGNVYNNVGIENRQELLSLLFNEMGGPVLNTVIGEDKAERNTDEEIFNMACNAINGQKFLELYNGEWAGKYPSQSEADFALVDIIAFYTQNKAQIARIYKLSALGQTPKDGYAHRADRLKYVDYMVQKSFDRQLPKLDIDGLRIKGELIRLGSQTVLETPVIDDKADNLYHFKRGNKVVFPPGVVGELAEFILDASPRRVPLIALAGAIGIMSGITGRAYNVNGAGLNQYIAVIANTGSGKDVLSEATSKLFSAIEPSLPNVNDFKGPGQIASAQGLVRWLEKKPSVITIIGELGLELANMAHPRASPNAKQVQTMLLKLYTKSGFGNKFDATAYADMGKNTAPIVSPSFTLLGESTPSEFYGNLDENMIARGLLPRFLIFEHKGKNPYLSDNHKDAKPSLSLVEKASAIAAECLRCQGFNQIRNVVIDPEADKILRVFEKLSTDLVNQSSSEITKQLWNRAHLKAMKLAAVISVGINYLNPTLTSDLAQYAISIVEEDINNMISTFAKGDIGVMINTNIEEFRQINEIGRVIHDWFFTNSDNYKKYKMSEEMQKDNVLLYNAIQMKLFVNPLFKKDKFGATAAIKKAFQYFTDADDMAEIPRSQARERYNTSAKCFAITNINRFREYGQRVNPIEE